MFSPLFFKVVNIVLLALNAFVFFAPKRPMQNVNSNAAGILGLIALVMVIVFVTHLLLTIGAIYFEKATLLKVITWIMIPLSLVFWFYTVPMIRL
ncbi:MAG: hypothetical protein J0L66_02970 [Cytophagales bacterium]|nr:hypothetical protein [Cytophagales bacterium]